MQYFSPIHVKQNDYQYRHTKHITLYLRPPTHNRFPNDRFRICDLHIQLDEVAHRPQRGVAEGQGSLETAVGDPWFEVDGLGGHEHVVAVRCAWVGGWVGGWVGDECGVWG